MRLRPQLSRWARLLAAMAIALLPELGRSADTPTVTLGAEDDAAPWSYADGSGYVNDLVREAFEAAGWSVDFRVLPYARCKLLAVQGQLAGCFSASETPELRRDLLYPEVPVFEARNVLFTTSDAAIAGCDPRTWGRRASVGFVNGYEYLPSVDRLRNAPQVLADVSSSEVTNLRKLAAHRLDAALITLDGVKRIDYVAKLADVPPDFKPVCDFGAFPSYVAFSRLHPLGPSALAAFNRGIAKLQHSGEIARLQHRWASRALEQAVAHPR
jgi:polar amino acid transport system substrate-binding protein